MKIILQNSVKLLAVGLEYRLGITLLDRFNLHENIRSSRHRFLL